MAEQKDARDLLFKKIADTADATNAGNPQYAAAVLRDLAEAYAFAAASPSAGIPVARRTGSA